MPLAKGEKCQGSGDSVPGRQPFSDPGVPSAASGRNRNCFSREKRKTRKKEKAETARFLVFLASSCVFCGSILLSLFLVFLARKTRCRAFAVRREDEQPLGSSLRLRVPARADFGSWSEAGPRHAPDPSRGRTWVPASDQVGGRLCAGMTTLGYIFPQPGALSYIFRRISLVLAGQEFTIYTILACWFICH